MAQKKLIERVYDIVKSAASDSPMANCGRRIVEELRDDSDFSYGAVVEGSVADMAQKYGYCKNTQEILIKHFRELNA